MATVELERLADREAVEARAGFLLTLRDIYEALPAAATVEEAKKLMDDADLAGCFAQTRLTKEDANDALEVYLWAQRRLAQIFAGLPRGKHDVFNFASELGINRDTAYKWGRLAEIPDDEFRQILAMLRRSGAVLSHGLVYRQWRGLGSDSEWEYVERGIYRNPRSGALQIRYKRYGERKAPVMPVGSTIDDAREELLLRRGNISKAALPSGDVDLSYVYESLIEARSRFDAARVTPAQRAVLAERGATYSALDDFVRGVLAATNVR